MITFKTQDLFAETLYRLAWFGKRRGIETFSVDVEAMTIESDAIGEIGEIVSEIFFACEGENYFCDYYYREDD